MMINNETYSVEITQPLEGTKHLTILIVKIAIVTTFFILTDSFLINRHVLSKIWRRFMNLFHYKII